MSKKKKMNRRKAIIISIAVVLFVILSVIAALLAIHASRVAAYPLKYNDEVIAAAKKYDLSVSLVMGVIRTESSFVPTAVSIDGAVGLMQLMPDTADWIAGKLDMDSFKVSMLNNPATNIELGCWYLRYLMDTFNGDLKAVLAGYNAGQNRVRTWLNNPAYVDSQGKLAEIPVKDAKDYVEKVLYAQKVYQELYKVD